MEAIGYVRVSTEGQVTEGISLEAQQAKIEAWCQANGYHLLTVEIDAGLSGGRADNRPALQQALAVASEQKAALVVYSLSRLARSTKDAIAISERLEKHGADLVSLSERIDTTTAAGKMIFRLLAVLAEFERDQISERTKGAMAHLRRQRKRISRHLPYGYDLSPDGITLASNPDEQRTIALARQLRAEGHSLRTIAQRLHLGGMASKQGRQWTPKTVRAIVMREVCAV